jgi:SNF2 family DNA or RNA helicase
MKATSDNAVEGTPVSDPISVLETPQIDIVPVQETPVSDPILIQGSPEIDTVPIPETPASDFLPIEGTPQNEIIPKSDEVHMQLESLLDANPWQQQTTPEETPNADDEELFVIQDPPQRQIRRTPRLTHAEIRESVKIGLDDSGAGKIPRSSLLGASLRPNINNNNKGKGRKRSRANDVDVSTLAGTDLIADAQANFGQLSIPVSAQGNKQSALSEMVASLPPEARSDAIPDKQLVIDATKKFTQKPRPDKKGGWKHPRLKTSLYHHQVLGAAFMREREKSKEQPTGGMLCDVMGLGKTIQTLGKSNPPEVQTIHTARSDIFLANIVDDSEELEDNANTTLIVAPRGLIDHW